MFVLSSLLLALPLAALSIIPSAAFAAAGSAAALPVIDAWLAALRRHPSDYVRHSAGNALRDMRRAHAALVDAETAAWDLGDPRQAYTYKRVLAAR